jgi:hypothetical protein
MNEPKEITMPLDDPHLAYPDRCYREDERCGQKLRSGDTWYCSRSCELAAQYGEPYPLICPPTPTVVEDLRAHAETERTATTGVRLDREARRRIERRLGSLPAGIRPW